MRSYKVEGIIIKKKNFGEADRLLTILSREKGKIRLVAKGSRRLHSKLGGMLQTFNYVNLVVAKGKNLDVITGAHILKACNEEQLLRISEIFAITEILDKFLAENDPHPKVYDLVEEILENFDNELALSYFKFKLLCYVGFAPELEACVNCGVKLTDNKNGFDISEGVLCTNCLSRGLPITNEIIKILRLMSKKTMIYLKKLEISSQVIKEVAQLIDSLAREKSHYKLSGDEFIREVESLNKAGR